MMESASPFYDDGLSNENGTRQRNVFSDCEADIPMEKACVKGVISTVGGGGRETRPLRVAKGEEVENRKQNTQQAGT